MNWQSFVIGAVVVSPVFFILGIILGAWSNAIDNNRRTWAYVARELSKHLGRGGVSINIDVAAVDVFDEADVDDADDDDFSKEWTRN